MFLSMRSRAAKRRLLEGVLIWTTFIHTTGYLRQQKVANQVVALETLGSGVTGAERTYKQRESKTTSRVKR